MTDEKMDLNLIRKGDMDPKLKNNKLMLLPLFFIIFSFIVIQNSRAAQVTFVVEGNLNYVDAVLSSTFSIGDLYHLEYTFDSTMIDSLPGDPNRGIYENAISSLSVSVGGYTANINGQNMIDIYNNRFDGDVYSIWLSEPMIGNSIDGYSLSKQSPLLLTGDGSGAAFMDDSLITYALNPLDFIGYMALEFVNLDLNTISDPNGGYAFISADISSFQVSSVPVPSAFWLFLPGLISLFGISKFKK